MVLLLFTSFAAADTFTYGTLNGTSVTFQNINETNNSPDNDTVELFGAPQVFGDQLYFFPQNFSSESIDGVSDITTSTLQVMLVAQPGETIERVRIQEFGDYLLTGSGDDATQADASLFLTVTALGPSTGVETSFDEEDFDLSIHSGDGFDLFAEIVFDDPVTMAMVNFNNNLSTTSEAGTTSFIQKKVTSGPAVTLSVNPTPIPVPGAAWLVLSGVAGLVALRKATGRKTKQ
jgi:hypothetical protein